MRNKVEEITISKASRDTLYHLLCDEKLLQLLLVDNTVAGRVTVDKYGVVRIYKNQSRWWSWLFGEYKSFDFISLCMNVISIIADNADGDASRKKERLGMVKDWIEAAIEERDFDKATYMIFSYYWFQYTNLAYRKQILKQHEDFDVENNDNHTGCRVRRPVVKDESHLNVLISTGIICDTPMGPIILGQDGELYEVSDEYLSLINRKRRK